LSEYPGNDKYFPKKGLILVMSLLLSMSFGIFLCFLLEYLDDTIKTTSEINENLNQPVLGVVRMVTGRKIQNGAEQSVGFSDDFWDIRSNIKIATLKRDYKMLAVTSAARGEGKSTVSKSLAQVFVESGQKVLLIDLNFRRPFLHKMLNLPNTPGLVDFLKGEKKIQDIIFPIKKEGVDFIPAGNISSNPLKMIDSLNMLRFMQSLRTGYDVIICDTPAIEDGSDCSVIGSFVDDIIFVVGSGEVSRFHLKKALEIVGKANANLLGVVLNKAVK
jgi:capsular exopolysaccharide synthesis family protein